MSNKILALCLILCMSIWLTPARAEENAQDPDRLRFMVEPCTWLYSMTGSSTANGSKSTVRSDINDLLALLDETIFLFAGRIEVSKGKFALLYDGYYEQVEDEKNRSSSGGLLSAEAKIKFKRSIQELALAYQIGSWNTGAQQDQPLTLDILAGARDTYIRAYVSANASVDVPIIGQTFSRSGQKAASKEWINAFAGGRVRYALTDRMDLGLRADVGGFGVESDFTWNAIMDMRYYLSPKKNSFVSLGYRGYGDYYKDDNFKYELVMYGPIVSGGFVF